MTESPNNDKALRLKSMLEEALQPLTDKIGLLEQEVKELRKEQAELKQIIHQR
ncbi:MULTISPECIES: hypothetical protein [Gracilibacillus]|uniref:hypothetical protein n=1 Tax=Gracilibacillus TaxID=74385 RepID=UPI000AC90003|nr:hypothetical protein [Gracilibacillus dipsosauri]